MKPYYCVYVGFYGCPKNELYGEYETELAAKWGAIAAHGYGYETEIRVEYF